MSLTYGFYNSYNHDRLYDAIQFGSIFDGIINDGVFMSIGDRFMVRSVPNTLGVQVGTGRAWFFHTWSLVDAPIVLSAPEPELLTSRIDEVVLEVNYETRENSIKIIKGTGAVVPQRPNLIWTNKIHQYPLAYYRINPGDTYIPQANITNMVGSNETPFVTGIIDRVSVEDLILQWQDEWLRMRSGYRLEFELWFKELKAILDGDVAANMAAYILDLRDRWRLLHREHITIEPVLDEDMYIVLDAYGMPVEGVTRFSTYFESVNTDWEPFRNSDGVVTDPNRRTVQKLLVSSLILSGLDQEENINSDIYGLRIEMPSTSFDIDDSNFVVNVYAHDHSLNETLHSSITCDFSPIGYSAKFRLVNITVYLSDVNGRIVDSVSNVVAYDTDAKAFVGPQNFHYVNHGRIEENFSISAIMEYEKPV